MLPAAGNHLGRMPRFVFNMSSSDVELSFREHILAQGTAAESE